jgi:hypothetical protein
MESQAIKIRVSNSATSDTRFKIRVGVALAIVASIGTMLLMRWLFGEEIAPGFWSFALIAAIPSYLLLYALSIFVARTPRFKTIEFSTEGMHFPPLTNAPIPWLRIDAIQILTDTQHGIGQRAQVDINRNYYRTIKSEIFDFAKDEPKRIFTCNIAFHLGVLEQTPISFEQLVDQFAPNLKKKNVSS